MLARVRILTEGAASSAEAVAVPVEALRARDGARARVVVAVPDAGAARTEPREITLGDERANGWIEVAEGLAAGDRVVVDASIADRTRIAPVETPKSEAP
jgi:multidrug efflux pump subunit AcrA (membrane-fusion protein)